MLRVWSGKENVLKLTTMTGFIRAKVLDRGFLLQSGFLVLSTLYTEMWDL